MNEQQRAYDHLTRLGIAFRDNGCGFFVYGRWGRYLSAAEALKL